MDHEISERSGTEISGPPEIYCPNGPCAGMFSSPFLTLPFHLVISVGAVPVIVSIYIISFGSISNVDMVGLPGDVS